jgi:hypothetical protein
VCLYAQDNDGLFVIRSEITVMGRACNLRGNKFDYSVFQHPLMASNELIDGSIIDVCGVTLLFQSPVTMAYQLKVVSCLI